MTVLIQSAPFFRNLFASQPEPIEQATGHFDDVERREIVGDMIAAGACESEHGVQMFMSVFPDQF